MRVLTILCASYAVDALAVDVAAAAVELLPSMHVMAVVASELLPSPAVYSFSVSTPVATLGGGCREASAWT